MLKQFILTPALLMLLAYTTHAQCPEIVWEDNFDGNTLDLTKWTPQIGNGCDINLCGWGNNELEYYTDLATNLQVTGGNLVITARKEQIQTNQYSSARIRSLQKAEWTYGRMEARMKLPTGQGIWPAFWMLPTDEVYGGWPRSGEIDIMEMVGNAPNTVHGTLHYGDPWPNNKSTGNDYKLTTGIFNDDFHVFAIEWEENEIRWYVDGTLFSTKTKADLLPSAWPFDQDFHFLLNLAVGGNWPGNPDVNTVFPQTLIVDYVRVYSGSIPKISGVERVDANQEGIEFSAPTLDNATYNWSVPSDATIVSGQGTTAITVNWGETSAPVSVEIGQPCGTNTYSRNIYVNPPLTLAGTFENFDDKRNVQLVFASGTYTQAVANPDASGVNQSAKCGKYDRDNAQQYDVLSLGTTQLTNASLYTTGKRIFSMDVMTNAPEGTLIFLQLENSATAQPTNFPTGRHSRFVAYTSKENEWERLHFELDAVLDASVPSNGVNRIIILFNSNSFTGHTYYFDNFDSYIVGDPGVVTSMVGEKEGSEKIRMFPNPASSHITLQSTDGQPIREVAIITEIGVVQSLRSCDKAVTIATGGFSPGLYFVKVRTNSGVTVMKLAVQ